MILTGAQILNSVESAEIIINPFSSEHISTNSYDLLLGGRYIRYLDDVLYPDRDNRLEERVIPDQGLVLEKGDFILAESVEVIGSDKYVPMVHGKSGVARKGLFIHITADLVDIGYKGKITLQLYATQRVMLKKGIRIAQLSFWVPKGEITLYNGKYQNGTGPQASKIWLDNDRYNDSINNN